MEREREPVTPVDRQQLLVGHGAECMVGQEAGIIYFEPQTHYVVSAHPE